MTTGRFAGRATEYARGRPDYPAALGALVRAQDGLSPGDPVVDLGAGTGISIRPLVQAGFHVSAVEPDPEMAEAARAAYADDPRVSVRVGRAEDTGLPDGVAAAALIAQAFHWMDPVRLRAELHRILRPPRLLVVVWNRRRLSGTPFLDAYEAFLQRWGTDYREVSARYEDPAALRTVFGHAPRTQVFDHRQRLDRAGLEARLTSSSYLPKLAARPEMGPAIDALFDAHAEGGEVELGYDCAVYFGALSGDGTDVSGRAGDF